MSSTNTSTSDTITVTVTVGVLALQGAFAEHLTSLQRVSSSLSSLSSSLSRSHTALTTFELESIPVKTPEDLERCDALIIPGGESTSISLLIHLSSLFTPLVEFTKRKPVWGTCAGAILLARSVGVVDVNAKSNSKADAGVDSRNAESRKVGAEAGVRAGAKGEPGADAGAGKDAKGNGKGIRELALLGGISLTIARNAWGAQGESFEVPLDVDFAPGLSPSPSPSPSPVSASKDGGCGGAGCGTFVGVFIRAPVILALTRTSTDPPIRVLARLPGGVRPPINLDSPSSSGSDPRDADAEDVTSIVALQQGHHLLTTFHPELTGDDRFHEFFVRECVVKSMLGDSEGGG